MNISINFDDFMVCLFFICVLTQCIFIYKEYYNNKGNDISFRDFMFFLGIIYSVIASVVSLVAMFNKCISF